MSILGATTGYKRVNSDGSRNVWCPSCRRWIGTSSGLANINTATCAVCMADQEGIELTEEQARELRAVRVGNILMSENAAYPDRGTDPLTGNDGNNPDVGLGRVGYFVKALMNVIVRAGKATGIIEPVNSKEIAKENKRRRVFDLPLDKE